MPGRTRTRSRSPSSSSGRVPPASTGPTSPRGRRPSTRACSRPMPPGGGESIGASAADTFPRRSSRRCASSRRPTRSFAGTRCSGRSCGPCWRATRDGRRRSTGPTAWPRMSWQGPAHWTPARPCQRTSACTSSARTSRTPVPTRSTTPWARRSSPGASASRASSPRPARASTAWPRPPPAPCSACPASSTWARSTSTVSARTCSGWRRWAPKSGRLPRAPRRSKTRSTTRCATG